jgi:hypothetical protein
VLGGGVGVFRGVVVVFVLVGVGVGRLSVRFSVVRDFVGVRVGSCVGRIDVGGTVVVGTVVFATGGGVLNGGVTVCVLDGVDRLSSATTAC